MSAAFKCDKCEQLKEGTPTFVVSWQRLQKTDWGQKEVCNECGWPMYRSVSEQATHERLETEAREREAARTKEAKK